MARAQVVIDASPFRVPTPKAVQMETLVRRYYELFNQRRLDEAERFVDPQALFTYPVGKEHFIGRAGYRELTRRWLEGFPDAHVTITTVLVPDEHTVVTEWVGDGTHLGTLELPGFPALPATGVRVQLPMREIVNISDGRIVASRMEFDPAELLRRLGLKHKFD
jgi:steroid delta-isomerase-like uncharacterized protein